MSMRPSRLSLPSSQATASAKARWISSPMMRMPAPPSLFVQSGSWRATRHLLIRAHGASGKVARGGHVTSSGSQPTVYRRPARTFVLPAPRVPDGLTITPSPFRKQADTEAPADLIPDNGQVERMNRTIKDATVKRYFYETHDQLRATCATSSTPTTSPDASKPSGASPHTNSSAKPGLQSLRDSNSIRSSKRRD